MVTKSGLFSKTDKQDIGNVKLYKDESLRFLDRTPNEF